MKMLANSNKLNTITSNLNEQDLFSLKSKTLSTRNHADDAIYVAKYMDV